MGYWIRALSFLGDPGQFWLLLLGTFLAVASQTLVCNSISLIANTWFGEKERGQSTAISGLVIPVGSIVGFTITGVVTAGMDVDDPVECMNILKEIIYA